MNRANDTEHLEARAAIIQKVEKQHSNHYSDNQAQAVATPERKVSIGQQAMNATRETQQGQKQAANIAEAIKTGFKGIGSHILQTGRDKAQEVDTADAAGKALGGPFFDAGKEIKGIADNLRDKASDQSTVLGKIVAKVKEAMGADVKTAEAKPARETKARDENGRFIGNNQAATTSDSVVSTLKANDKADKSRHKELVAAVKSIGGKAQPEAGNSHGLPRVKRTGPGSSQKPGKAPKEKPNLKNVLKRGADGKLNIRPKAGGNDSGSGIGGALLARGAGALMGGGGGMLAGLTGMIGPAIAVAVAGAAGAAIGTGISGLLDKAAQKATGDKNATAGGAVFDFFHPGTGKDTKFENKYQQYQGDVQASSQKYGVSEGYMKTMMKIESGGDPNAVSSTGAKGLYQFTGGTAKGYGIKGQEFNPSANIDAAARLARDNAAQLQRSGIAVNDSNMYMSHQLGVGGIGKGGLKDLLNSSQTGAPVSAALRKQMDVNGGQGMDAQAFLGMWRKKWINTAQSVGADPNSMARGKQSPVTPTAAPGSPEYEKQLAEFKAKEGAVATPPATTSTGPGSRKKKGKGYGTYQKEPVSVTPDASKEGEQAGSGQKASAAGPAVTEVVSGDQKDQQAATVQSGNSVKAGSAPAKPDYAGKAEKMFEKADAELPIQPSAAPPLIPAPAPVQPPPPLEAMATKAPAMSYDDQQAAREGIQKDYWAKEDARRSQSGEAFKQVKGQQAAITAEKEAKLSDIEKRRKEVDAKYDAGGLNDAEAGKQQVALDAEAEQVKKEHLAKMGDAITGGFKGVDAQSGQLLAEKDAKGKALDAQITGVPSQVAIPATAVASTAAPVAPAPAPVQPPPPLEAMATKAPAMSYDDQQAAREGIQKDYWAKEDARRSQSGEVFKQVKGQQAAITAEKEAKLSDIEKRRKEVDAKYDAGGLNDAEAGKQQVALDAEAEQVKKEHLAKMGDAITGGFKGVDAQSGQLLAEKDAKGKALDAQITGVSSQVAIPATAVASTAAPVAPAPAPVQPPPPAPVNIPEVSQLAAAMQQNNQKPDGGKQPGTSVVTQNTIKTEFDDTMLTLMAYDRI